jgi:hypothetical protein
MAAGIRESDVAVAILVRDVALAAWIVITVSPDAAEDSGRARCGKCSRQPRSPRLLRPLLR